MSLAGDRPRKYSSRQPGLAIGSNVGFGMKRLTLPRDHQPELAVDRRPLHAPLLQLGIHVTGEASVAS